MDLGTHIWRDVEQIWEYLVLGSQNNAPDESNQSVNQSINQSGIFKVAQLINTTAKSTEEINVQEGYLMYRKQLGND